MASWANEAAEREKKRTAKINHRGDRFVFNGFMGSFQLAVRSQHSAEAREWDEEGA